MLIVSNPPQSSNALSLLEESLNHPESQAKQKVNGGPKKWGEVSPERLTYPQARGSAIARLRCGWLAPWSRFYALANRRINLF
jgi:hypothetical protein